MARDGKFLSRTISLGGLGRGLAVGILGLLGLLLAWAADPAEIKTAGLLTLLAGGALLAGWRLRTLRPRRIQVDEKGISCWLPGLWVPAAGVTICLFLAAGWIALIFPKMEDMWLQTESNDILRYSIAAILFLFTILLPLALSAPCWALLGSTPWRMRAKNGTLMLWYPHRRLRMPIAGLRVVRVVEEQNKLRALHLAGAGRRAILPANRRVPAQAAQLEDLAAWLGAHGAAIEEGRPLIFTSAWLSAVSIFIGALAFLACLLLAWGLSQIALFWFQWWFTGSIHFMMMFQALAWGFPLGLLLACSPLFGWITRLLGGAWLERTPPHGTFRVLAIEALHANEIFTTHARRGTIREKGGALCLTLGAAEYPIAKDDILELEPLGLLSLILPGNNPNCRFWGRPVRLCWREPGGVVRGLMLISRSGRSNGHDLRLDQKLFTRLSSWRRGEAPLDLTSLKVSPVWPGVLAAALFLAAGLGLPPLHNHLLLNPVRTGAWHPPARAPLATQMFPFQMTHGRVNAESIPLFTTFSGDVRWAPVLFTGDPLTGRLRPLRCGTSLLIGGTVSFPDMATHLLAEGEWSLGLAMVPPHMKHYETILPPQIIDLKTGLGRDLRSLPDVRINGNTALYRDQRIFYTQIQRVEHLDPDYEQYEYGWIDVARDQRHPLGTIKVPRDHQPFPVFFPGGRCVLFDWRVIDLEGGAPRPLVPLPAAEWKISDMGLWATFAHGPALLKKVELSRQKQGGGIATNKELWSIDPATARIQKIALPAHQDLIADDENRWLLAEHQETIKGIDQGQNPPPRPRAFSLYDPSTGALHPIFHEVPAERYYFVSGGNELLSYSQSGGWRRRTF